MKFNLTTSIIMQMVFRKNYVTLHRYMHLKTNESGTATKLKGEKRQLNIERK